MRLLQTLGYSLLSVERLDQARRVVARMGRIADSREDREISESLSRQIEEQGGQIEEQVDQTGEQVVQDPVEWTYEYTLETETSDGNQPGRNSG